MVPLGGYKGKYNKLFNNNNPIEIGLYNNQSKGLKQYLAVVNKRFEYLAEQNKELLNCIDYVNSCITKLKANANFDMCIDLLILNIWEEVNK